MKKTALPIFLLIGLLASGCSFTLAADVTPPPGYQQQPVAASQAQGTPEALFPLIPPDPYKGKAIYQEKCAPCHGDSGLGDGERAQDLPNPVTPIGSLDVARQASPAEWFTVVTEGNLERFMPPFTSLTDRQRWDVVAYAFSLSKTQAAGITGTELYTASCAECHAWDGKGDPTNAATLELPDLSNPELQASKTASDYFKVIRDGASPGMPAFGEKFSEDEIWALTDFLRSLNFVTVAGGEPQGTLVPAQNSQATAQTTAQSTPLANALEIGAEPAGSITGQVMNGSGGASPSGAHVILHAFDKMQLVYTATTRLDADGTYTFENLDIPNGRSFLATIDHQGLIYSSEFVTAESDQSSLELPIQLYDSIQDASVLSVDRLHFFFEMLDKNAFRVVELYVISNPGNKTLVASGQGQPVVRFSLPPQAGMLEFEDGELGGRYIKTEDGFGDTVPVYPGAGAYQVLFSYTMPYDKKLELSKKISMNTSAVVILVPEASIKVKGEGLEDGGTRDVQGTPYHMYNGGKYLQGEEIKLVVTGRPVGLQTGFSSGSNQNLIVGFGALGLVLVIAGLWLYQRSRSSAVQDQPEALSAPQLEETEESLMDAILALDDLYQEGKLPEDAYFERRGELKNRLKQLREKQG